jgi:hypothetical protein
MVWVIGLAYWAGAALLWLPFALALRSEARDRHVQDLLAGIVLAAVWPLAAPVLAVVVTTRRVRAHRAIGQPVPVSVLVRS